jgi:hypothetical protein
VLKIHFLLILVRDELGLVLTRFLLLQGKKVVPGDLVSGRTVILER